MRNADVYAILIAKYFALSRKNDQRNNVFRKRQNLNLKIKF